MNIDFSKKNILRSSLVVFLGSLFDRFFRFLSGIIVARILGPSQYGVFSLARNVVFILTIFTKLGLDLGIVKLVHQNKNKEIVIRTVFQLIFFTLFISFVFVFIIYSNGAFFLSKYFLRHKYFEESLKILIFSLPFITLLQVLRGIFRGYLQFFPIVFSQSILQPVSRILLVIMLFFLFNWRLKGVLYATVLSFCIASIYLLIICFIRFFEIKNLKIYFKNLFKLKDFWNVYKFSFVVFLTSSVILLLQRMDILMIGYFLPSKEVGKYSVIQLLIPLIGLIGSSLNQIIAPLIANAWTNFDILRIKNIMLQHIKCTFLVSLPILLIFVLYGDKLLLIFGSKYKVDRSVIIVLSFTYFFMYSFFSTGFVLSMTNKHVYELFCMSSALIFNFLFNFLFIPLYGLLGAALGTFIGILMSLIFKMIVIYKSYKIHIFSKDILWLFLLLIFTFCLGIVFQMEVLGRIAFSEIFQILFALLFIILMYTTILLLSPFRQDILFLLNLVKNRF